MHAGQLVTDEIVMTRYNDSVSLAASFEKHGDKLACFIVEPVIGAGGRFPDPGFRDSFAYPDAPEIGGLTDKLSRKPGIGKRPC